MSAPAHAALHRFLPTARFGEIRELTPMAAGLSGATVYSVTTDAGDFVLRLHGPEASGWDALLRANRLAAEHGIAPPLVHVDEVERAAVSAKITGSGFGPAMARPSERGLALKSLIDRFAALHAIPLDATAQPDPVGFARSIWNEQARRPGFPMWAEALVERIDVAADALSRDMRRVFSHNDPHPSNLLWDGARVWLVDWERAGLSHPYIDLATFSNFINLADDDALGLLALQERSGIDDVQRATFLSLRAYSRVVYGAVFLRLVPDLTSVPIASRTETPTLAECYGRMATGALDVRSASGQALLGAAFLRQVAI